MVLGETNHFRKPPYLHLRGPLPMEPENAKKEKKNKKLLNQTWKKPSELRFCVFFIAFKGFFCSNPPKSFVWWGIWTVNQSFERHLGGSLFQPRGFIPFRPQVGIPGGPRRSKELRVDQEVLTWKKYGRKTWWFFQDSGVLKNYTLLI